MGRKLIEYARVTTCRLAEPTGARGSNGVCRDRRGPVIVVEVTRRVLALRRADACVLCGSALLPGTKAWWDPAARTVTCLSCAEEGAPGMQREHAAVQELDPVQEPLAVPTAIGGGSAHREYERRHAERQQRVRARYPKLGGLLLALVDDPSSTKVWAQGAAGERAVAKRLALVEDGLVLHDRRLRTPDGRLSRANIDHIVIVPSGVWVIDAKTHRGRLEVRRGGGFLGPTTEQLRIGGRDQTKLVDGIRKQVDCVRAGLAETMSDVQVHGALCFYGTGLPWMDEDIGGIPLRGRRGTAKLLGRAGPLGPERRDSIHRHLAWTFPSA